jgi:hypothetical protein
MKNSEKLNSHGTKSAWQEKLAAMTDKELFKHCEEFIWLSAYASNNPHSDYHFLCDAGYEECARRGNVEIYSRAHKQASGSAA